MTEEFTWLNRQGVKSNLGYSVQCISRYLHEYQEGGKKIEVETEIGFKGNKPAILYKKSSFNKWSNFSFELSKAERSKVIQNFRNAIIFQGLVPIEHS